MSQQNKYLFSICCKSDNRNEAWALKKKVDSYKLPTLLCKQYKEKRKPPYDVFFGKTYILPGESSRERGNLDNSYYLIVVCSPRYAESKQVTRREGFCYASVERRHILSHSFLTM